MFSHLECCSLFAVRPAIVASAPISNPLCFATPTQDISEESSRTLSMPAPQVANDGDDLDDEENDECGAASESSVPRGSPFKPAEINPLDVAADRLVRQLVQLVVETATHSGMVDLMRSSPMACVKMSADTGNVLLFMDLNICGGSHAAA